MVMLPKLVSSRARFHESVDTGTAEVVSTDVTITLPLFDSEFAVLAGCWVQPAASTSPAMSMPARMKRRSDDILN